MSRKLSIFKRLLGKVRRKIASYRQKENHDPYAAASRAEYLKKSFCYQPFSQMDVYEGGKVYSCCSAWLPTSIGNIRSQKVRELWNSPLSQSIREGIHNGSFSYCNHKICPAIQARSLPTREEALNNPRFADIVARQLTKIDALPTFINLCNDASCNLSCPSCRTDRIIYANGPEFEKRKHLQDLITEQLFSRPTDRPFTVSITGSGDPFASAVFREFLFNLEGDKYPNLNIHLQTNGVLLTPGNWKKMEKIHDNIKIILVSFDAASEATYQITRRGGHWPTLLKNVERLGELRSRQKINHLRLDFVVQKANYREMAAFVALGKQFFADRVAFSMLVDWGTWPHHEFIKNCVWNDTHPEYGAFMDVLKSPVFDDPVVYLGNLSKFREMALTPA